MFSLKRKEKIKIGDKVWIRGVDPQTFISSGIIVQCPNKEHPYFLVAYNDSNNLSHLLHGNFKKFENERPSVEELLLSQNKYVRAIGLQFLQQSKTVSSKPALVTIEQT